MHTAHDFQFKTIPRDDRTCTFLRLGGVNGSELSIGAETLLYRHLHCTALAPYTNLAKLQVEHRATRSHLSKAHRVRKHHRQPMQGAIENDVNNSTKENTVTITPNTARILGLTPNPYTNKLVYSLLTVLNLSWDRTFLETYSQPHIKPGY